MLNGNRHSYFIILGLILILFSTNVLAQVVIIPDENLDDAPKSRKIIIDGHMLELAENYVYLLDQIEFLTEDYAKYFVKCNDISAQNYSEVVKNFNLAIKQGKYFENLKEFNIDLEKISAQLNNIELNIDDESKEYKFKQLFKNFSQDLDAYKQIYKNEILVQLQEYKNIEDLQLYLFDQHSHETVKNRYELITKIKSKEKELLELQSKLTNLKDKEQETQESKIIIHLPKLDEIYAPYIVVETLTIEIPEIPISLPELEAIPEVPEMEDMIFDPIGVGVRSSGSQYQKSYGEFWSEKSFKDSSSAISTSTPIYLFNPTGDISVKGWNKNYLLAKSEISVTADSEKKAEKFTKNINIQIYKKDGKLFVDTEIPKLKDPKTKIVDSHIILKIPKSNKFICKSSQGLINISDMNNSIKLKASFGEIEIDNIKGSVEILNDNGNIEIIDVTGDVTAENSFGEIEIAHCSGHFNIENSYHSIDIIDCSGDGRIKNSGMISILSHNGNLDIRNKNGNTDINMHTGDLQITSSHAPMTLSDIRGNVMVNNLYAPIKANNIIGLLSASNSRSLISISDFQGPLSIVNVKGKIILNVPKTLSGDATIIPNESFVDISISENSNFNFSALTEDGNIQTLIPMSITHEGNQSKAVHTFGDGNYKFIINGKKSNINIKEY